MTDPHWPFPSLQYPLTPPKQPEYSDYAIKFTTKIKSSLIGLTCQTKVSIEDALL